MMAKKEEPIDVTPIEDNPRAKATKATEEKPVKEETKTAKTVKTEKTTHAEMKDQTKEVAHVNGPILLGAGLLILGAVLLAGELLGFHFWSIMWPFIFIVPGGVLFISSLTSADGHGEGLAILGSMMMMLGAIFLFQYVFNMWASWAYAWALLAPTSIGIAQVIYGKQKNRDGLVKNGTNLIEIGLTMFIIFFIFFELLLNISDKNLIPFGLPAFPVALIALGLFVILRAILRKK
ncbi:MAG: hypothetical protein GYA18_05330 [Chloroflexi bacterium]|nr:hypothetical protein [Chloroflexota bacterium]